MSSWKARVKAVLIAAIADAEADIPNEREQERWSQDDEAQQHHQLGMINGILSVGHRLGISIYASDLPDRRLAPRHADMRQDLEDG